MSKLQYHRHIVDHCGDARRSIKRQRAFSHNVLFNVIDGHKGHVFNDDHDADPDDDENDNNEGHWKREIQYHKVAQLAGEIIG